MIQTAISAPAPRSGTPWKHNMLNRIAGGRALILSETCRKVVIIMSTYEELSLIVSIGILIVAILSYAHKK